MRLAVVYPSAAWSTRDVAEGYAKAFEQLGFETKSGDPQWLVGHVRRTTTPRRCR